MNHTRTREQQFTAEVKAVLPREAVEQAIRQMIGKARNEGYSHEIEKTFLVTVVREGAGFSATAVATYAKIVPASTSARPATPEPVDESL